MDVPFISHWLKQRRERAEKARQWQEQYDKLLPWQKDAVRELLNARLEAAYRMRGIIR